ncbi:hypothetical protein BB560_006686 [Smittium megazygosporum]|uniref:Acyl-CoA desaturase n=1 Tax=Smittium megazygosporum TaxID=133381 RepID=A0A2T9Y2F3_9FUNG|nr:hypothetical protein BB560_006686 [Smittium megazygosporum]
MSGIIEKPMYKPFAFPKDGRPFIKKIHWVHVIFLFSMPLIGIFGIFTTPLQKNTLYFSLLFYLFSSLGITAGYHRLWTHGTFKVTRPLEIFFVVAGSSAAQQSILHWVRDHRAHHRYTDTPFDPHSIREGFFHTYMGWLLINRDKSQLAYVDMSDLKASWLVRFQHKYYYPMAFICGFLLPTAICGLGWGDWVGGFFYAAVCRYLVVSQLTFLGNAFVHLVGSSAYGDTQTSKDSLLVSLLTIGEGYHNFHHEFPNDYRTTAHFYQYDVSKWFIWFMAFLGLAYDLKVTPKEEVEKCYIQTRINELNRRRAKFDFGPAPEKLPQYTPQEFIAQVNEYKKQWMVIDGAIYDVSSFIDEHPGGKSFITSGIGKDMTNAFNGGVYQHHSVARNRLCQLRVGTIID